MSNLPPSLSRPAPQVAAPIVHLGVRYQQDQEGTPGKEPGAAYLAAIDPASERLLWLLKIADGIHHPPGSPWELDPVYFQLWRRVTIVFSLRSVLAKNIRWN